MTQTTQLTLEEFLTYDDGTDTRYELVDGVLVEMGAESTINNLIAGFLFASFLQLGIPSYRVGFKQLVAVSRSIVREPDLIVHSEGSFASIDESSQAFVPLSAPPPKLIIEVVSPGNPGSDNYDRDYIDKRREYALRGIPEYWVIDPVRALITVFTLNKAEYEAKEFSNSDLIVSPSFAQLQLTADQVLRAGR